MTELTADGVRVLSVDAVGAASMVNDVWHIVADAGRLNVLVNNVGYGSYDVIEDVAIDEANRQFEVHLFALARLSLARYARIYAGERVLTSSMSPQ